MPTVWFRIPPVVQSIMVNNKMNIIPEFNCSKCGTKYKSPKQNIKELPPETNSFREDWYKICDKILLQEGEIEQSFYTKENKLCIKYTECLSNNVWEFPIELDTIKTVSGYIIQCKEGCKIG